MLRRVLLISLMLLPLFAHAQQPPATTLQPYDAFNQNFLDPTKWALIPTCSTTPYLDTTASINLLDCARFIQNGKLRLMVKAYGRGDSDTDRQFGPSELYFANPTSIQSIALTLRIAHTDPVGCPTNSTDSIGQVLVAGTLFNTGTGDPKDDVNVLFLSQRLATDSPGVVHAGAALFSQNAGFGWLDLGAHQIGVLMNLRMTWDQPHHKFVFRLGEPAGVQAGNLPYAVPDTMLPVVPMKLLAARAFVPNCTSQLTSADIDVSFDNIFVNP